jgi:cytochrome c biogenesis protein CcmG, thiol:disulfide interchange protein DsbE
LTSRLDSKPTRIRPGAAIAALCLALVLGACGSSGSGAGNPDSAASIDQATAPLDGAPPRLAAIRAQANQILDGGLDAYDARIEQLRGLPIVVNNWGSWCGPCRLEFPDFQSVALDRGGEVAFLGVDTDDSEGAATTFLEELPLPYPSYADPDFDISDELDVGRRLPATAFYDRSGELVHTKIGVYTSAEQLNADIDQYTG